MRYLPLWIGTTVLFACHPASEDSDVKAPPLSSAEALEDLETLSTEFRRLYGPLEFKEQRFGFTLEGITQEAKGRLAAATSESEKVGALMRFLGHFNDGHVQVTFKGNATEVDTYTLGLLIAPFEGRALVAFAGPIPEEHGVKVGDELLSIDGVAPYDLLSVVKEYDMFANDVSDEHLLYRATSRPFYIPELVPTKDSAVLKLKRPSGTTYTAELLWKKNKSTISSIDVTAPSTGANLQARVGGSTSYNAVAQGTLFEHGAWKPYFVNAATESAFGITQVEPDAEHLAKFGLTPDKAKFMGQFAFYAGTYTYQGKRVLLIRQAKYTPDLSESDMIKAYEALLDQYKDQTDVLVIDQNHNPGGSISYALSFFQLFIKPEGEANSLAEALNADRRWIYTLEDWAHGSSPAFAELLNYHAAQVDKALDDGINLMAPIPLLGPGIMPASSEFSWSKPILVLADELSGSCGDVFPMLMQRNGMAKIFGKRTMGLGGNVEEVVTLPNTQAKISLTRGFFTIYRADGSYSQDDYIENTGVAPDLPASLTAQDFLAGFPAYFDAVSKAAIAQIAAE